MVTVNLITPEKLVLTEEVDMVVAPSADGELGVLANHAPLLAQLVPGEVRLKKGDQVRYIAVSGGFLQVQKGSQVSIFAESAEDAEQIDLERARQAEERAKAQISTGDLAGKDLAEVEAALTRAALRIRVAGARRGRASGSQVHN